MNLRPQLPYLTGLRAVAAYMVLLAHLFSFYGRGGLTILRPEQIAYFGMALFFVLSGFVITYNYSRLFSQKSFWPAFSDFAVARFARLYPLYLLFLLVSHGVTGINILFYTTLTQAWINRYAVSFAHAWSISAELFFYLLFALAVPVLNRIRRFETACLSALVLLTGSYIYLYVFFSCQPQMARMIADYLYYPGTPNLEMWLSYYSPYAQFPSFLIGCLSAKLYLTKRAAPQDLSAKRHLALLPDALCVLLLALVALNSFYTVPLPFWQFLCRQFFYAPLIAALLFSLCAYGGVSARLLSLPFIVLLGEISYSVYILQHWIFPIVGSPKFSNAILSVILCTLFSYGTYTWWEVPARRFIRARWQRHTHRKLPAIAHEAAL